MTEEALTATLQIAKNIKELRTAIKATQNPATTISVYVGTADAYLPLTGLLDQSLVKLFALDSLEGKLSVAEQELVDL